MCGSGQQGGAPSGVLEALEMISAGFAALADADMTSVPASVQAECLRGLERVRSVQTAAQARVLGAFDAGLGFEDDGCRSPRTWLMWQTQVTSADAAGSVRWVRRLRGHPTVRDALRHGAISASWARQICDWSDSLPETARADADGILLRAAAGGAGLDDLARLVEQIRAMLARPDEDRPPGFDDRQVRLATTLGGAGRLDGDLTPQCAAALQAVLDALGKKIGPEDVRTAAQRRHDALAEACRRLAGSGCLPDRAGQPTQIQLHVTLEDLLRRMGNGTRQPGDDDADRPVLPGPAAMPGDECDATIIPVVTGRVDHDLLDKLTAQLTGKTPWSQRPAYDPSTGAADRDTVRDLILANALALLSGPGGLASVLRTGTLPPPAASISLPLDVGTATDTIPAHLRRAVILRDKHCAAPGCTVPPPGCQIHHLTPRSRGGPTSLGNLGMYCTFHHLIAIHQWGFTVTLNPDGTTTMRSPDGTREYHSHSPPTAA